MSVDAPGPRLRLWGIPLNQVPSIEANANRQDLENLLTSVLQEAVPFVNSISPDQAMNIHAAALWESHGEKQLSSKSLQVQLPPVQILKRKIAYSDLRQLDPRPSRICAWPQSEHWFARRSEHANEATKGNAHYWEFQQSFKVAHAESEADFTPNVVAHRVAHFWDCGDFSVNLDGKSWKAFTLEVVEMQHSIGLLLDDRVFGMLQMTCATGERLPGLPSASNGQQAPNENTANKDAPPGPREPPQFMVVSIPIKGFQMSPLAQLATQKDVTVGKYVSVERFRLIPGNNDPGHELNNPGKIEWIMATASDAKGMLPPVLQRPSIPKIIAQDVSLFLAWIDKKRQKGTVGNAPDM